MENKMLFLELYNSLRCPMFFHLLSLTWVELGWFGPNLGLPSFYLDWAGLLLGQEGIMGRIVSMGLEVRMVVIIFNHHDSCVRVGKLLHQIIKLLIVHQNLVTTISRSATWIMLSIQIYCGLYHHIRCTFFDQTYYHLRMMDCLVGWQSHISPKRQGIDPSLPPLLAWGSSSLLAYMSSYSPHMRFRSPHMFEFSLPACEGSFIVCATLGLPTP